MATGAALAFASGLLVAAVRGVGASGCARVGFACTAIAAPFFALREVVASGAGVEGPVASTVSGSFAGGVGARIIAGPSWTAVSRSSVFVGVSCGIANAMFLHMEKQYKMLLLQHSERLALRSTDKVQVVSDDIADPTQSASSEGQESAWFNMPSWVPSLKLGIDEEYLELIRRRDSTIAAIEEEHARIAALLDEIEIAKAGARLQRDAGTGSNA